MPSSRVRLAAAIFVGTVWFVSAVWYMRSSMLVDNRFTSSSERRPPRVHVCIFTGRWKFLRVHLPYLFRELRQNGGVVDKVYFIMIQFTDETISKLEAFAAAANSVLGDKVFEFHRLQNLKGKGKPYRYFYYDFLQRLTRNPSDIYFKLDDDIVYYHPNVFGIMLERKNSSECFMHFGNIVSNWRCNWLHQQIGVYDQEVNPKRLKFDYSPSAKCGWKDAQCAELALRTFLYHYNHHQLDKYLFSGRNLTTDRKRFSINFHLLDIDLVDVKSLLEAGPIDGDEHWWTVTYSQKVAHPNCIVGEALVVHFSYFTTMDHMLGLGLLKEFESIVLKEVGTAMPSSLWKVADFDL